MSNILEVTMNDGTKMYIETFNNGFHDGPDAVFVPASSGEEIVKKTMKQLGQSLSSISNFSNTIIEKIRNVDICPNEIEVDFSVKFSADANVIISSMSSEANFIIKMKWNNDDKERK